MENSPIFWWAIALKIVRFPQLARSGNLSHVICRHLLRTIREPSFELLDKTIQVLSNVSVQFPAKNKTVSCFHLRF